MVTTLLARTERALSTVQTTRFGAVEVEEEIVVEIPEGLIGFAGFRRFVLLDHPESSPIKWLQSIDDGKLAFPVIDPWEFRPDYAPTLSDQDARVLGLTDDGPKLVLAVVTIPRDDPRAMSANLLGPIVINPITRLGKQVIVLDEAYMTKHRILDELTRIAALKAA